MLTWFSMPREGNINTRLNFPKLIKDQDNPPQTQDDDCGEIGCSHTEE